MSWRARALMLLLTFAAGCSESPAAAPTTDAALVDTPAVTDSGGGIVVPADVPPVGDPLTWDVLRAGPFRVGYRVLSQTYTPRGSTSPRTIPVHVWYPTHATDGPHPRYFRLVMDNASVVEAPLAPSAHAQGYPVHVYSHGDRGFGATSHFLSRHFASHGWVVVAPDHVGNTLSDTPDPRPLPIHHLRSQDVKAALDLMGALPVGDPLAGRCNTQRVLLSGHSFGTHTVWTSAGATFDIDAIRPRCTAEVRCTEADLTVFREGLRDGRIVAAIPMAGSIQRTFFGTDGHRAVSIPLLAMSGTDDPVGADAQFMTTEPVPLTWIDVRGGCHQFFALGNCSMIGDDLQVPIVGGWALAFGRRHVLRDEGAAVVGVLDGTMPVSDRVVIHRR